MKNKKPIERIAYYDTTLKEWRVFRYDKNGKIKIIAHNKKIEKLKNKKTKKYDVKISKKDKGLYSHIESERKAQQRIDRSYKKLLKSEPEQKQKIIKEILSIEKTLTYKYKPEMLKGFKRFKAEPKGSTISQKISYVAQMKTGCNFWAGKDGYKKLYDKIERSGIDPKFLIIYMEDEKIFGSVSLKDFQDHNSFNDAVTKILASSGIHLSWTFDTARFLIKY